ncbi:large neutral amino acids transporter small subunit 1 [Thozetella sp. PMI_491]|nr:large neutral amino acids transporter small subunit 1 [Thozetella sp. PMI_491]
MTGGRGAKLTRLNGLALVISLQIGSGIFSAPSQVSQHVSSPGQGLLVWFLGGLLVWTGAASFIELGLRVPSNGGIQEYLRACYGDGAGFLFTYMWVVLVKPCANAIIATIFADYLLGGFFGGGQSSLSPLALKAGAIACVAGVTLVNCLGASSGAKAANVFLVLKLGAVAAIIILGGMTWAFGGGDGVPQSPYGWFGLTPTEDIPMWAWIGNFASALFGALFCYGGWETIGFVLGDMANPEGDLPFVINGAMTIVIFGFCLLNAAIYICLPMDMIRGSSTVVVEFARRTIGSWGSLLFSVVVSISAMGALNANVFATAKLCVAASRRTYFPAVLANLHCASAKDEPEYLELTLRRLPSAVRAPVRGVADATRHLRWHNSVPIYALVMNALLASFFVVIGSFNGLVTFIGLAEYVFFLMSVVGLLVLRSRDDLRVTPAPSSRYTTWTGNPIIFSVVSALLILRGIINDPWQGIAIVLVGTVGIAVFYFKSRLRPFPLAAMV